MFGIFEGLIQGQEQRQAQSLAAQSRIQQSSQDHEAMSSMMKLEFDVVMATIERLASVGEKVANLTETQSQQLAN